MINRKVDRLDCIYDFAITIRIKPPYSHDLYVPIHANNSFLIIANGADRARTMRSMTVAVHRVVIIFDKVKAMLAVCIGPNVVLKVLVRIIHAGVDNRDYDIAVVLLSPGRWCMNVLHPPEFADSGIIRASNWNARRCTGSR